LIERVRYRFDFFSFVIEEGEIVFHKADNPDVFLDLFNTDILPGKYG